jgi:hypothetical protein
MGTGRNGTKEWGGPGCGEFHRVEAVPRSGRRGARSGWFAALFTLCLTCLVLGVYSSPACGKDTVPPVITITAPTEGQQLDTGSVVIAGTIMDSGTISGAWISLNGAAARTLTLGAGGAFQTTVALVPGTNVIAITAKDRSKNSATAIRKVVFVEKPRAVRITSPQAGDQVPGGRVDVVGTRESYVTRVYVQGREAWLTTGGFHADGYPLKAGLNEIRVAGCDDSGVIYEDVITVSCTSEAEPLILSANPPAGVPPLTVGFSVSGSVATTIASCEIDFEGTGDFVLLPRGLAGATHTYVDRRLYRPMVRVTATSGQLFSAVVDLPVVDNARFLAAVEAADPVDLAFDGKGRLLVVERGANRVSVLDAAGNRVAVIGSFGSGVRQFNTPSGVAVDGEGRIYVADRGNHRIQVFDAELAFLCSWGRMGSKKGQLTFPDDVAVGSTGDVFVLEVGSRRIQRFTWDGYYEDGWEVPVTSGPGGIAHLFGEYVAVAETSSGTLLRYSTHGSTYPWEVQPPALGGPRGLATGAGSEYLVVAEGTANRVTVLTQEGSLVRRIATLDGDPLGLSAPTAAVLDNSPIERIIWIADGGHSRVVKATLPSDSVVAPAQVWDQMRQHLRDGDPEAALLLYDEEHRGDYRELFNGLGERLTAIAQEMGDIAPIRGGEDEAIWGVVRFLDGEPILFDVIFRRDRRGEWKIVEF